MKYFLYLNNMALYEVPEKHWHILEVIEEATDRPEHEVNQAILFITKNCKVKLTVSAVSQFL